VDLDGILESFADEATIDLFTIFSSRVLQEQFLKCSNDSISRKRGAASFKA